MKIISSNIKFKDPSDAPHTWEKRLPILSNKIESFEPDFLATQEGRFDQLKELDRSLNNLSLVSSHRDWIENRMYPCIFHNPKNTKIINSGDIWLSKTPNIPGSSSFESAFPRLCTWIEVLYKNQTKFLIVNTHLDHIKESTRVSQIKVLIEEIIKLNTQNLPLILCGDFNDPPDGSVRKVIDELLPNLIDPWTELKTSEESSYHKFKGSFPKGKRIDWTLVDKALSPKQTFLDKTSEDGIYPSDHFIVKLELSV